MPTGFAGDAEIERIARGLLDRSLPKEEWTHAAHFAAVIWLLRHRGVSDVTAGMPAWIRAYNEFTGGTNTDATGYHETITMASIRAAAVVLATYGKDAPLHEVVNGLMTGELGRSDWLLRYWSRPRLFSTEARKCWLEPDLGSPPY